MSNPFYKTFREPMDSGFRISYITAPGGYHPPHWHEELEILYHLNGESEITIEGKKYQLLRKHMIVIDSRQVHSTYTHDTGSMFVCIHISKKYMEKYIPGVDLYKIHCTTEDVNDENFQDYLDTCMLLQDLTRIYVRNPITLSLETESYILQIFAKLILHFSTIETSIPEDADQLTTERIRNIISYVAEHFTEPISLDEIAGQTGFSKEYFCRFFKKYMGKTFLQYLNEVRATHVYLDLENTDLSIAEIMEQNGFTNQKLFNQTFKKIYGCTPMSVKHHKKTDPLPES